jgi:hypothetical protein
MNGEISIKPAAAIVPLFPKYLRNFQIKAMARMLHKAAGIREVKSLSPKRK